MPSARPTAWRPSQGSHQFHGTPAASAATCAVRAATTAACSGRKRNEGKGHKQALLALARRRANVLWAMLRDGECYEAPPTVTSAA